MKSTNRMWLKAAAATVGVGALTFGAVLPATAADEAPEASSIETGDKYEAAAAISSRSAGELKQLEASGALEVTDRGLIAYIDPAHEEGHSLEKLALPVAVGAPIPGNPAAGSRPGAPVTVFLDFDGATLTGTGWNDKYNSDSLVYKPAAFADAAFQAEVWAGVAEDYAPFNVNVTITDPGVDKLYKTAADDNEYGSHVIITDSYTDVMFDVGDSGGIAFEGGTGTHVASGAFVFTTGVGGDDPAAATAKSVANTASHESGHNFGLGHDGIVGGQGEYFNPAEGVWSPIMGGGYRVPLSQWSKGEYKDYVGTHGTQDDLAVITDRSAVEHFFEGFTTTDGQPYVGNYCGPAGPVPGGAYYIPNAQNRCDNTGATILAHFTWGDRADYAADQVGNDAASAASLANNGTFAGAGVIERTADIDVFSVITAGGAFTAEVEVADLFPNLDAKLTLTDANGNVLDQDDPAADAVNEEEVSGLGAAVSADVPAGIYYLTVDGVGFGDPNTATAANANGYTEYGSLGNYSITGSAPELKIDPVVIVTPVDGAKVEGGSDVTVTGTATPDATVTLTVGGNAVTATADADGKWTATVKANKYGNTVIVASQKIGTIPVSETDTATVTAPVPAPVITSPVDGATVTTGTPTISGTGIPGAVVEIGIGAGNSGGTVGTATVAADGTWSFTLTSALVNGAYSVGATQSINDVVSDGAENVDFIVNIPVQPTTPPTTPPTKPNGNGNNLATTGGDFDGAPFALLAAGVLMAAGATAFFGFRQRRKVSVES